MLNAKGDAHKNVAARMIDMMELNIRFFTDETRLGADELFVLFVFIDVVPRFHSINPRLQLGLLFVIF